MQNKITHWIAAIVLFGLPIIINSHSPMLDVSVGAVLNGVYLWLSHAINPTSPIA